jgi:hypothetical protein
VAIEQGIGMISLVSISWSSMIRVARGRSVRLNSDRVLS